MKVKNFKDINYKSMFSPSTQGEVILRKGRIIDKNETPSGMIERMVVTLFEPEFKFGTPYRRVQELVDIFGYYVDNKYLVMSTPIMNNAGRYSDRPLSACTVPPISLKEDLKKIKILIDKFHIDGMGTGFDLNQAKDPIKMLKYLNNIAVEGAENGREDRPVGNMAVLSIHSPFINQFINIKNNADQFGEEWKFNISVDISDAFMQAYLKDKAYILQDGCKLNAREMLAKIAYNAHKCGDPGLLFMDRMNYDNPLPALGKYVSTAPCAEVALVPGESCQFGYINLAKFVKNSMINLDELEKITRLLTRVLDNALEISIDKYPHMTNKNIMRAKRKIGVGVCGLADMFIKLKLPYNSPEARKTARDIITFINYISKVESHSLAETRGSFEALEISRYNDKKSFIEMKYGTLSTSYVSSEMWVNLAKTIKETQLMRNVSTIALPPTGRSGIVIDASTGIEPLFSLINYDGSIYEELIQYLSADDIGKVKRTGKIEMDVQVQMETRNLFKTSLEITPEDHMQMVQSIQLGTDESISKTINLPSDATIQYVEEIYKQSYLSNLKGITVFRTGCRLIQPRKVAEL